MPIESVFLRCCVYGGFRQSCEQFVGFAFFGEGLLKKANRVIQAEFFCPSAQSAVTGDFIMFNCFRVYRGRVSEVVEI